LGITEDCAEAACSESREVVADVDGAESLVASRAGGGAGDGVEDVSGSRSGLSFGLWKPKPEGLLLLCFGLLLLSLWLLEVLLLLLL